MESGSEPLDPRAPLAAGRQKFGEYRTQLALDRTTLAWIRTALTFATFGFGMIGFFRALRQVNDNPANRRLHEGAIHFGVALVVMGIVGLLLTAATHWSALRRMRRGEPLRVSQWPLTITISVLVCALGLYGLWFVLFE
jgi:putative membrane protein